MKTELQMTMELEVADVQDAQRFEEKLRGWLRHQSQVVSVSATHSGVGNDVAWRDARRAAFGSPLPNPFAPGRSR
ncbi:hypothetical protein FBZ82_12227 [Azospirillum brasilense]|uniref:Uncharacterized protein n=1 Tax=Azospirillum brasilense TaxID=192 RepID=A0A560AHH6_AZOBR|nr:hypothetical protein [Azospirillum brasilense]TWA59786.1 hypothetical protein FBZ82_12227 [Azospirillum brasilense]